MAGSGDRKLKIPMFLENTSYSVLVDMKEQPATWRVAGENFNRYVNALNVKWRI